MIFDHQPKVERSHRCVIRNTFVPPVGFEPTTNGLKVHCANQLRHGGGASVPAPNPPWRSDSREAAAGRVWSVQDSDETTVEEEVDERTASSTIDLSNRPEAAWLDQVDGELDDVDTVLKCLARDNATICTTCDGLQADGALDARPVLSRCASTKQPKG